MELIYKIVPAVLWEQAAADGIFAGAPLDRSDGYIHFSTAAQVRATAAMHFAGQADLLLVGVDPRDLGGALRYEPARGGALFPHLYAPLSTKAVAFVRPLPLMPDGTHDFDDFCA